MGFQLKSRLELETHLCRHHFGTAFIKTTILIRFASKLIYFNERCCAFNGNEMGFQLKSRLELGTHLCRHHFGTAFIKTAILIRFASELIYCVLCLKR